MLTGGSSSIPSNIVCPLLVGRDQQLDQLKRLLDLAANGEGQVVLIASEAGGGKTRLIGEIRQHALQAGFADLQGECFDQQQHLPYSALRDMLRRYLDEQPPSAASSLFDSWLPHLSALLPEIYELQALKSA